MGETLLATALFLVPGYVAVCTRRYRLFMPPLADIVAWVIAWSAGIYLILSLLWPKRVAEIFQASVDVKEFMSTPSVLWTYMGVIVFAAVLGYVSSWILTLEWVCRLLGQRPYESVWDEFWVKNGDKDQTVAVLTSAEEGWLGKLVSASGSGSGTQRELWLTDVLRYQDGSYTKVPCEHLFIDCKCGLAVMVLPEERSKGDAAEQENGPD